MLRVKAYLAPSPLGGIGCFTEASIAKGEVVWELDARIDRLVPLAVIESLPSAARDYLVSHSSFDGANCLLCYDQSTFINHSPTPNTGTEGDRTIALRDIQCGEEITENYHEYDHEGPDRIRGRYEWERLE